MERRNKFESLLLLKGVMVVCAGTIRDGAPVIESLRGRYGALDQSGPQRDVFQCVADILVKSDWNRIRVIFKETDHSIMMEHDGIRFVGISYVSGSFGIKSARRSISRFLGRKRGEDLPVREERPRLVVVS